MYLDASKAVWGKAVEMNATGSNIDAVILARALHGHDAFGAGGVVAFLTKCMETVPYIEHVTDYAAICIDTYRRRQLLQLARKTARIACDVRTPFVDPLRQAVSEMIKIAKASLDETG